MHVYVVIATKGRAAETKRLLDNLQEQTRAPDFTVIAGGEASDLDGIATCGLIEVGTDLLRGRNVRMAEGDLCVTGRDLGNL